MAHFDKIKNNKSGKAAKLRNQFWNTLKLRLQQGDKDAALGIITALLTSKEWSVQKASLSFPEEQGLEYIATKLSTTHHPMSCEGALLYIQNTLGK